MKKKSQRILEELAKMTSKELIAVKLHVSGRTIERWINGDTNPPYTARKLIAQIYNGYKSRGVK